MMKNSYKKLLVSSVLCLFMQPVIAEQSITTEISEYGDTLSISPSYNVASPQNGSETGLGLRLHFDSSKLDFVAITDLYSDSSLGISAVQNDTENTDQDDSTDKVIVTSWLDISGQWPGADKLPLKLYTAKFDKKSDYTGATNFRFSSSSHAVGSTFRAEAVTYSDCAKPEVSLTTTQIALYRTGQKTTQLHFNISTPWAANCAELEFGYVLSGTVVPTDDKPVQLLKMPVGAQQVSLTVNIDDYPVTESDETLTVTLVNSDDYSINQDNSSVSLTLRGGTEPPEEENSLSIPTLSEWMMILMSLGLWGIVILRNYRKEKQ